MRKYLPNISLTFFVRFRNKSNIEDKIYNSRKLLTHEIHSKEFDQPKESKKEKRKYVPQQSHPWKLASFEKYLRRIGKTLLEYQAENSA
ncbi:hypothetical protein Hs30E_07680 [Lactococcus hodotermopsidis]|uniref:Uncharacterized protein n=1 Tax=Pseudolactococcus hodotermopsidis TaxID=2709157 RepID=A0A6A0BEF8_9LACT|nr:hypothetical protein [Lactococcus hodotermopsidis]GFH42217.1 hypothetical protein Hs30E_07680 [Lactococcus hodotermopsidis]